MQQRLSSANLWNVLQRDRFYRDETSVRVIIKELLYDYLHPPFTFDLYYELVGKGYTTIPALKLIFILCGLCRLNTYPTGKDEPTGWFGQEFADRCSHKLDLEIDRDEFKEVFQRLQLPLPQVWFPDDAEKPKKKDDLDVVPMVLDAVTEESSVPVFCFYKEGEHWWIGEKGNERSFNKSIGLGHIHFLLKHPNKNFLPTVVYHHGRTSFSEYKKIGEIEERDGTVEEGNGDKGALFDTDGRAPYEPRLDAKGHAVIKAKISELEESLSIESSKDPHEALEIKEAKEEKIEKLKSYLQEHGKGRKLRDSTSQEERARKNVSKAIDRALSKIHEIVPSLEQYLNKHTIKKGDSCSYKPLLEDQPDWILYPEDLTS